MTITPSRQGWIIKLLVKIFKILFPFVFFLTPALLIFFDSWSLAREVFESKVPSPGSDQQVLLDHVMAYYGNQPMKAVWAAIGWFSLFNIFHFSTGLFSDPNVLYSYAYSGVVFLAFATSLGYTFSYRLIRLENPNISKAKIIFYLTVFWFFVHKLSLIFRFSHIPWTHYQAAFVGVIFFWIIYENLRNSNPYKFLGLFFTGVFFYYTRRHEFFAVAVAGLCGAVLVAILKVCGPRSIVTDRRIV